MSGWTQDDRDAASGRVRRAAQLSNVEREESGGHVGYSARGKRFAWFQVDQHCDGRLTLSVEAPPGERQALLARGGGYFAPFYLGSRERVGVDLAPGARPDRDEMDVLVEQAWRTSGYDVEPLLALLAETPAAGP